MDPQQIINVCEANWDANKSDCNHFVKAVANALGVAIFDANDNADTILSKLSNAPSWTQIPDRATVESDAAAGYFIIAGLQSTAFTPPRQHGHVVVVVEGDDEAHPGYPMAYWGTFGGVGQENSSIRNSFTAVDLPNVQYFGNPMHAVTMQMDQLKETSDAGGQLNNVGAAVERLLTRLPKILEESIGEDAVPNNRLLFPNGIDLIDIEIKAGPVDFKLKLAGPKAGA